MTLQRADDDPMVPEPLTSGLWEPVLWDEDEEKIISQIYGCDCDEGKRCEVPQCVMRSDIEERWMRNQFIRQRRGLPSYFDDCVPVSDPDYIMTEYEALEAVVDAADLFRKEQREMA